VNSYIPTWLRGELQALVRLALPMVIAQLGMVTLGVVDSIMVGHLSELALAAVGVGYTYTFAALVFGQGILHALDPLVSQAHGAGDENAIALAWKRGLVLALVLSVPFMIAFQFPEAPLRWFGQSPEIVATSSPFIRALAPGVPGFFLFFAFRQTLQARGVVRPVLLAVIGGNLANVVGNLALIYGMWGAPRLGVVGSAWSTSICRWVMAGGVALLGWPALAPSWRRHTAGVGELAPYLRLLALGVPIGVQIGLEMWVFTTAALLIGSMGTLQMSAHQIAITLASTSFMVPLGIGAAAATRVGNAIGRGEPVAARRSATVALMLGGSVMTVSAAAFWSVPRALAHVYTNDTAVIAAAAQLLPIAALFQIFDGLQAVGCGVLRGVGDTRAAAVINFFGYWVIGLPVGVLLGFRLGLGPRGVWWGLTVGLAIVAVLIVARIRSRFRHRLARV
jgi:MATE family multidrug resistance protein